MKKYFLSVILSLLFISVNAQCAGGDIKTTDGSIAYSVGLVSYETVYGLEQGLQHTYSNVTTGLKTDVPTFKAAYPNPVIGTLIMDVSVNGGAVRNITISTTDIHYVGEQYGQGIVFYVTDGGRHGLIAALSDISGLTWCSDCTTPTYTGATSTLIGSGEGNTLLIMARADADPNLKYAAKSCYNYQVSGNIGGWYLPSKAEAAELYKVSSKLGSYAITSGTWTSTESSSSSTSAWTAGGTTVQKSSTGQPTRPIRKF